MADDADTPLRTLANSIAVPGTPEGSRKKTTTRSSKQGIVPHLAYELRMMLFTFVFLDEPPPNRADARQWTIHNAMVESWSVHARALIDFLFSAGRDDDVSAVDFVPSWLTDDHTPSLRLARFRVNKEIAHLTYDRLKYQTEAERSWEVELLTEEILSAFQEWLVGAPDYVREGLHETLAGFHTLNRARSERRRR